MTELYLFTDGQQTIGFSPHLFSETWDGILYTATAVSRSALNLSGNLVKSQVTFTFPNTNAFAKRRVFDLPDVGWDVKIYEDYVLQWSGRVIGATLAGTKINIVTDSSEKASSRNPTGARFALHCWKNLYSATCGIVKASFKTTLSVTVSGTTITLPGVQDLNKFAGGVIEKDGESRRIVMNSGTTLEISTPFVSSAFGSADLYLGCNLTSVDCIKFNNLVNFGGFEHIPILNPMERSGLL
jgi:hypothetical protein